MRTDVLPVIQVTAYLDKADEAEMVPFGRHYRDGYRYAIAPDIIEVSYIPQADGGLRLRHVRIRGLRMHLLKSGPHTDSTVPFWHELDPGEVPGQLEKFIAIMAAEAGRQRKAMAAPDPAGDEDGLAAKIREFGVSAQIRVNALSHEGATSQNSEWRMIVDRMTGMIIAHMIAHGEKAGPLTGVNHEAYDYAREHLGVDLDKIQGNC